MSTFCHFFDIPWNWPKMDPFVERIPRHCTFRCSSQISIADKKSLASGRPAGRPAPREPRLKTSKMCRFFWTPKRAFFWLYLALKCPLFVTFLTSPEIGQKWTLLLKEFPVIFTFRIVFTRHSVAPDWQKVLFFKITIVLTASCQNHYRFDDLWSFIFCDNFLVIFDTPIFGQLPF